MKNKKLDKTDVRDFSIVLLVVGFAVFAYFYLSNPTRLIGQAVEHMGYNTELLEVERVDFWKGIYKANIVVTDKDGREVEYWRIKEIPHFKTLWYAEPYEPDDVT